MGAVRLGGDGQCGKVGFRLVLTLLDGSLGQ